MGPGFSERAFEFCYNHDYIQRNAAILATYPNIPSQRQERYLGYDVEFRVSQRNYSVSIFIQHKVSSYGGSRAGRNAVFYDQYNAPYYRFPIDNDQHTRLQTLSRGRGNTFYCAPKFHTREDLHDSFQGGQISRRVILLDPTAVGPVGGNQRHNITYDTLGNGARLHSEVQRFDKVHNGSVLDAPDLKKRSIGEKEIKEEAEIINEISSDFPDAKKLQEEHKGAPPIAIAQILLGQFYGVSWIIM